MDDLGSITMDDLRQNCISVLDKPGRYACKLCHSEFSKVTLENHLRSDRKHRTKFFAFMDDIVTLNLPPPTPAHVAAINEMCERYSQRLLTPAQISLRMRAIAEIEESINQWFPRTHIELKLYGSTVSGFALDSSDVNVELVLDNEEEYNPAQILQKVEMHMEQEPTSFSEIHKEFDLSSPRFSCCYSSPSLGRESPIIHFGVYSASSREVSEILAKYASLDPRVPKLAACFKIWAQMCGFDRPDHGFWPSHAFHIMVIHFCQSTSPPILPSLYPPDGSAPSKEDIDEAYAELLRIGWVSQNTKNLGQLWLDLLAFYAKDLYGDKNVVNLRGLTLRLSDKKWTTCILAVEDPVHHSNNLSRSIGRKDLYFNYHHNLVRTFTYFMTPRTRRECLLNNLQHFIPDLYTPSSRSQLNNPESDAEETNDRDCEDEIDPGEAKGSTRMGKSELNFKYHVKLSQKFGIKYRLLSEVSKSWERLLPSDFYFTLEINKYPFFRNPPKYCIKCKRIDHYKSDCDADKLPDLIPVPVMLPPDKSARLDEVCRDLYAKNCLDSYYQNLHDQVLMALTDLVRNSYPNANLQLFGSSKNGFGAKKCDLDLCMTFADNETGKGVDQTEVINRLARDLKKQRKSIHNLTPIPQAKVPVLKLRYELNYKAEWGTFDCDISLYNLLALYNTKLLRTYCQIDERVAILGFTVKQFFKRCDICDASKGSLSSYAYTLMTIYYLQRCSPPVLPFLQEIYDGPQPPERIVDEYNTYFFDDLERLPEKWPYLHSNTLSVGNLFYGLLKFYAEIFPFDTLVVNIRRSRDLTKMEKKWTGRRIAIEDPFLLSHNLGQGIEAEMARYIKASIVLGRNRIGTQPDHTTGYTCWEDYFFDPRFLTDGAFPKGRGCHYCNKIGHQKSQCPERPLTKRERERNRTEIESGDGKVCPKQGPKGNHDRSGNEPFDSDLASSPPRSTRKSMLGNLQKQYRKLSLNQSKREQPAARADPEPQTTSGRGFSNIRQPVNPKRELFDPRARPAQKKPQPQQQLQLHGHQQASPRFNKRPFGNKEIHCEKNIHHHHQQQLSQPHYQLNHPLNNSSKRNVPPNNHQAPYPGNRQANVRFSPPRNHLPGGHNADYIFRSPDFPELGPVKCESNRRR